MVESEFHNHEGIVFQSKQLETFCMQNIARSTYAKNVMIGFLNYILFICSLIHILEANANDFIFFDGRAFTYTHKQRYTEVDLPSTDFVCNRIFTSMDMLFA